MRSWGGGGGVGALVRDWWKMGWGWKVCTGKGVGGGGLSGWLLRGIYLF